MAHYYSTGVKAALVRGSEVAVAKLGVPDGFLSNPKVKIPLPGALNQGESTLRMLGMGKQADELVVAMNRAAETAVPAAKPLLLNAVKSMSLGDAKSILTGGDGSVTRFFKEKTQQSRLDADEPGPRPVEPGRIGGGAMHRHVRGSRWGTIDRGGFVAVDAASDDVHLLICGLAPTRRRGLRRTARRCGTAAVFSRTSPMAVLSAANRPSVPLRLYSKARLPARPSDGGSMRSLRSSA
jgi:hypothetical protein